MRKIMFIMILLLFAGVVSAELISPANCSHLKSLVEANCSQDYELTKNVDCSSDAGFVPICGSGYSGTFDGQNHTVYDYFTTSVGNANGLFANLQVGGVIKNLGMIGFNVNVTSRRYGGGLVGSNSGTIYNCFSDGNVFGCSRDCGGLVGFNWGNISNCYSKGTVSAPGPDSGGLVGENRGKITNSYSTANVTNSNANGAVGGLVGRNYDHANTAITNCYGVGYIFSEHPDETGGLVGFNGRNPGIYNSYWFDQPGDNATKCRGGSHGTCTEETTLSNLYDASHNVYDTNSPYWNFTTVWTECDTNFPILTSLSNDCESTEGPDADNDTIVDYRDNCPLVNNTDQNDTDSDGEGDVCDCDDSICTTGTDVNGDIICEVWDPACTGSSAPGLMILVTSQEYNGSMGGLTGADAKCQSEFGSLGGTWKALLGVADVREVDTVSGPTYDWVLEPNTNYYRRTGALIGATNASAEFNYPLNNSPLYYNGVLIQPWSMMGNLDVGSSNCVNWNSDTATKNGIYGQTSETNSDAFRKATAGCNGEKPLYCVEQADQGPGGNGDDVIPEFSNTGKIVVTIIALIVVAIVASMLMKKKQPEQQEQKQQ